ncbi:unnamed protein product, partial [Symbiodinium pilosum]
MSAFLWPLVLSASAATAAAVGQDTARRELPAQGALPCSACLWSAKALRAALVEKMPKRVKPKLQRRLSEEVLTKSGDDSACASKRFPKQMVLWAPKTSEIDPRYEDFDEIRGGKSNSLTSEHFQLLASSAEAKGNVTEVCTTLLRIFSDDMVEKCARHEGRIYGALTDHWLCYRKSQLCTTKEAPPGKDDDEDYEREEDE